jgi:hypothetical protein
VDDDNLEKIIKMQFLCDQRIRGISKATVFQLLAGSANLASNGRKECFLNTKIKNQALLSLSRARKLFPVTYTGVSSVAFWYACIQECEWKFSKEIKRAASKWSRGF